jgi:predicted ATPase
MGHSLFYLGDLAQARVHYDEAIALYDSAEHRPLATRFGQDSRMAVLSYRSLVMWLLGHPEAALANSDQALSHGRQTGHAGTLMFALGFAGFAHIQYRNYATATAILDELIALADEKGASFWKAVATSYQARIWAVTGKAPAAVQMISATSTAFRQTGTTVFMPVAFSYLARAYAELGQFGDAWRCIGEAVMAVETTKETWFEAEINRMAGDIALLLAEPDAAKAQAYFERALAVARAQQAKSWELRAAMSMARLWRDQGKRQQARELLAPVYNWFTEGFDTLDLKEAKALLDELHA